MTETDPFVDAIFDSWAIMTSSLKSTHLRIAHLAFRTTWNSFFIKYITLVNCPINSSRISNLAGMNNFHLTWNLSSGSNRTGVTRSPSLACQVSPNLTSPTRLGTRQWVVACFTLISRVGIIVCGGRLSFWWVIGGDRSRDKLGRCVLRTCVSNTRKNLTPR